MGKKTRRICCGSNYPSALEAVTAESLRRRKRTAWRAAGDRELVS
jgi:hypothetical protein